MSRLKKTKVLQQHFGRHKMLLLRHSPFQRTVGILLCAFFLASTRPPSVQSLMLSVQAVFLRPGRAFPSIVVNTRAHKAFTTRLSDIK